MAGGTEPHLTWGLNTSFAAALESAGSGRDGCSGCCAWVRWAWATLTFRARGPGTRVQTANLGCWVVLGLPRSTGRKPCAGLCWAQGQTWLRVQSSILHALSHRHCWPLPRGVPGCSGPRPPRHALWPGAHPGRVASRCLLSTFALLSVGHHLLRKASVWLLPLFFTKFLFF